MILRCWAGVVVFTVSIGWAGPPEPAPAESRLKLTSVLVNMTPPPNTPIEGHTRKYEGVRTKLTAGVLVFDDGKTKAAIVTTDLIESDGGATEGFREVIHAAAGVPLANILVTAAHNHSGPAWAKNPAWAKKVLADVQAALTAAKPVPVTIGFGVDTIDFGINRRDVIGGRAVVRLNPAGPNDPRVKVLRFDDDTNPDPVAVLMHCVCHPCVHTWGDKFTPPHATGYPQMSADFPGEARDFVQKAYGPNTLPLFLQGCAGDIRPNLPGFPYRCGDEADIRWCGRGLGCAVVRASDKSAVREWRSQRPQQYPIRCASKIVELPPAQGTDKIKCELMALRVGPYLFLSLPGEPFVEYGLQLESLIGPRAIPIVVGYANGSIGYICTDQGHQEGGYEPNNSLSGPGSEAILIRESLKLADKVIGDVFEAFAPADAPARKDDDQ